MKIIAIITTLFLLIPLCVAAQDLSIINLSHLSFGNEIFPGSNVEISRTESAAASFKISGESGREIHITFDLPQVLNSQESEDMEVSFSSIDGGYHSSETEQVNATAFDPTNGLITTLGSEGTLYLWLGATIYPHSSQAGGYYSSDITVNALYTTN